MSDNPFAEPEDTDRTVVRGSGRPAPAPRPVAVEAPILRGSGGGSAYLPRRDEAEKREAPKPAPRLAGEAEALPKVGTSPLVAAAAPLLDLLARLSTGGAAQQPEPDELRERALLALRRFEADARAAGIPPDQVRAAHHALCASLDDVVLSTPWGAGSVWNARSLASTFHQEVRSGERFFDVLAGMQRDPGRYAQALEVAYLCLSLGFQGRYRLAGLHGPPSAAGRAGAGELDRIRESLYALIAQLRGPWERELSPRWQGVDAPHRPAHRSVPPWVAAAVAAATIGLGYALLSRDLNTASDGLFARLASLPPPGLPEIEGRLPPPVPKLVLEGPAPPRPDPQPDPIEKFRRFLQPEIDAGLVTVEGDARRVLVRIRNRGLFASGSASVDPRFVGLLRRVGEALRDEPGRVRVVGYTDDRPIRTVRFPSNFHLSTARAETARAVVAGAGGGDPARFTAEGRGEAEPVASNATPEGREENRRIEVVLLRGAS